jgi:pyroglutamyl-peptidase I
MKLLLTAFTPFGGESINPALEAVKQVRDKVANLDIIKLEVPTVFNESVKTVIDAMEKEKPDFVLCVGQAGGREGITPERVAINIDDARIPDNEGNKPIDRTIYPDGENAYFSNLPVKAMVEAIKKVGLTSSLSNSAGTYVCNHLMYGVLYHIDKIYKGMKGGFIHVPYIPEQTVDKPDKPSMPLKDIVKGLEAAIRAIAENEKDIKAIGGSEC